MGSEAISFNAVKKPVYKSLYKTLTWSSTRLRRRILIVDDDRNILQMLDRMLSMRDFSVSTAENAEKAMENLKSDLFQIVLTDMNMPGMDGITLAGNIKADYPSTLVVLMTGEPEDEVERRLGKKPFVDSVLYKPFHLSELNKVIEIARPGRNLEASI